MNDDDIGIIGSMAWFFNGARLRIVRFTITENLANRIRLGERLTTQPYETYDEVKRKGAIKASARRANLRSAAT